MPATLPTTGGETTNLWLLAALGAGLALIAGGLLVRSRAQEKVR
jgi:LPXTG-motif cell wall-anchored protein